MLDKLRRHRESYAAKILLAALALSFIIGFGVLPSLNDDQSGAGQIVAKVEGKPIYRAELDRVVQNMTQRYKEQYGTQIDDKMLAQMQLDQVALQTLINRMVILHEAGKAGLRVTDDDLRAQIMELDAFKNENGQFDPRNYERAIRGAGQGLTPAKFEADTRDSLLIERMQNIVHNSVVLTDDQLRELYVAEREMAKLAYVAVDAAGVAGDVKVKPEDVAAYYEVHKAEYALPEKRKFKYLELSPGAVAMGVKLDEKEVAAEYEKRKEEFKQDEQVQAAHILFKVEGDDAAAWAAAEKKAADTAAKAKGGADFGQLARTLSDDSSAANGGDLGTFGRGQMVKPFEDVAFALKDGEISAPVKTQFGWHVIKTIKHQAAGFRPLEEARPMIERSLRSSKAQAELATLEAEAAKALEAGEKLDAVAAKHKLEIKTTEFLAQADRFPGVLDSKPVLDAGFALTPGQTSKLVDAQIAKYVLALEEIQAPKEQSLAEVRPQVEEALRLERAAGLAGAKAAELLEAAKKAGSLKKVAGKLEVKETPEFAQIEGEVPGIGRDNDVFRAVYTMRPEKPFPERTFNVGGKYYVIQLLERKHADLNLFGSERETFARERIQKKQEAVFSDWLQAARARTKVENFVKAEAPAEGMPGGQPGAQPMPLPDQGG